MKRKLARLIDFLKGGPAPRKQTVLPPFHPIIFANGRDDDSHGMQAFWENRPVIFRGEVIQPDQPYRLTGLNLRFSCAAVFVLEDEKCVQTIGYPAEVRRPGCGGALHVRVNHKVRRVVAHSTMGFNMPVMP